MKPVHIRIREIREDRDLTQTAVAKALGITQQYYSKYETGKYEIPLRHVIGLAKLYHLNISYILGLTQYRYPIEKLKEPFLDTTTAAKLLSDATALNVNGRKALAEYLEFLRKKQEQA